MKRSLEMFISFHRSSTPGALHDVVHKLLGGTPASLALSSIFWPCSSVPVRNMTSQPGQPLIAGHGVGGHGAVGVADEGGGGHADRLGDGHPSLVKGEARHQEACHQGQGGGQHGHPVVAQDGLLGPVLVIVGHHHRAQAKPGVTTQAVRMGLPWRIFG